MTAQEFEQRFDEGEDITPFIDMSSIRRPGLEPRRVNLDFPEWMKKPCAKRLVPE